MSEKTDDADLVREALQRYQDGRERDRENIDDGYEDLAFRADGRNQWPEEIKREREAEGRPIIAVNKIPQFVRQVTGDMRQMRPAIKVVPVDDRGDRETAETMAGMIRYIENRSDAQQQVYAPATDSQVCAGIGHWMVGTEYAGATTFNQEIRISLIEDGLGVVWDPDAVMLTREDAMWCHVPVDMSLTAYKAKWPDAAEDPFPSIDSKWYEGWFSDDSIRVSMYFVKKPTKRLLLLSSDGSVIDLTDEPNRDEIVEAAAQAGDRAEWRDSVKVCSYLISASAVLDGPTEIPGTLIPVVPVIGEEVRVGRRIYRQGIVRPLKDPQRMYNYFRSAQTETVALQPKAPFIGTQKNFERYESRWNSANAKNWPYLVYDPDQQNGGAMPQRVAPPVSSQGINEGVLQAADDMKAVSGIYDASLGARSNETSGVAINARQREGDTGTYLFLDNFALALKHTGRIIIGMIPEVYDTERMIRIVGEDGKMDLAHINKAAMINGQEIVLNDMTSGSYDVALDTGPSYTTKREQAKTGMLEFVKMVPQAAPIIGDLVAKAQDWPLADEIGKRLELVLPPPIQAAIRAEKGEGDAGEDGMPPPQADPAAAMAMQAKQQEMAAEQAKLAADVEKAQLDVQAKEIDLRMKEIELAEKQAAAAQALPPDQLIQAIAPALEMLAEQVRQQAAVTAEMMQRIDMLAQAIMPPAMLMDDAGPEPQF